MGSIIANVDPIQNLQFIPNVKFNLQTYEALEKDIRENRLYRNLETQKINVFLVVEVNKYSDIIIKNLSKDELRLTEKDKITLSDWLKNEHLEFYVDGLYNLTLENLILLVKIYKSENDELSSDKIIYGIAINNTMTDKIKLLAERQRSVMAGYL